MKLFKVLFVLVLAGAIFGTAGFFAYQLYVKPVKEDRAEQQTLAAAPAATPTPDYSLPAFEQASARRAEAPLETRDRLLDFIVQYPQSSKLAEAKDIVGAINTQMVFTGAPGPDKVDYTVVSGDSLVRVATKTKSSAELILRSNNLATIDLQIGQQLRIPQLEPTLVLNRAAQTLTLLNKGQFFKEYPILSLQLPASVMRATDPTETNVKEKVAIRGTERVAFGSRDYVGSDRWLMLGVPNAIIRGLPPNEDGAAPAAMPPGVVLSQEDIEEIFPLVSRGTPVTIQ